MDFNTLGKNGGGSKKAKKDLPVNIAMRLDRIEISEGKPSFFHGFVVGSNEPAKVRMMTIDEGVGVNMRRGEEAEQTKARLQKQYAGTGEAHRPRPAEIANPQHKTHCEPGGLLMFTKALRSEDGSYRAHWVETMERSAGAGCDRVTAHIKVEDIKENGTVKGTQVVADVVNPKEATMLNKDNVLQTLAAGFANRDGEVKRKPFVYVRLINAENGANILPPSRASAKYEQIDVEDPDTGSKFKLYEAASAEESIKNLFNPENTSQDSVVVRAALYGLGKEPGYPKYQEGTSEALIDDLKKVTDGVRDGSIQVEVIPGERISAGPATRASIEKAVRNNANHPINAIYVLRGENGYVKERRFCDTFLTTKLGKDGNRYFTKAVPADLYPAMQTIAKLATVNDHKTQAEAAKARAAEATATDVVINEDLPLDPALLEGSPGDDLDNKLAQSAEALGAEMY